MRQEVPVTQRMAAAPILPGRGNMFLLSKVLVDRVGTESTTSSMPFLICDCSGATQTKRE